jgi:hypothetical protein
VVEAGVHSGLVRINEQLGPGVYSASKRNEYQRQIKLFLGSSAWPVREADVHTAVCEPIV